MGDVIPMHAGSPRRGGKWEVRVVSTAAPDITAYRVYTTAGQPSESFIVYEDEVKSLSAVLAGIQLHQELMRRKDSHARAQARLSQETDEEAEQRAIEHAFADCPTDEAGWPEEPGIHHDEERN